MAHIERYPINDFRKKYPVFVYEEYSWLFQEDDLRMTFYYSIPPEHKFEHKIILKNLKNTTNIDIENLIFHIGLVEIPSYWKTTCSKVITIKAGYLSTKQLSWWKRLFINGMGEYFYKNKIDFTKRDFLIIRSEKDITSRNKLKNKMENGILIPIGGGKDSAITAEILSKYYRTRNFIINPTTSAEKISAITSNEKPIIAERIIDPYVMQLNEIGFLNGHIPFSACIAFIALLSAYIENYRYIAISNERSSNEGNVVYLGEEINHQYSKSLEFESIFNEYVSEYISDNIQYFSFLRPLYDIQIAKIFSQMPKFFPIFRSCNRRQKENLWCGHCPKCISVALALQPWTNQLIIEKIFGFNPLKDQSNQDLLKELTGKSGSKPFECVMTIKEAQIAEEIINDNKLSKDAYKIMSEWLEDPNIPKEISDKLRQYYVT